MLSAQIANRDYSREIEDIGQPPINLITSGEARFDSRDVFSSPVCQPGTQISAIQYIHDWINEGEKALLWIYSHAGTGKSTLARTIARELTETGQIAAGYFFKRGVADRNDVFRVFPTIASQLTTTIPRYESNLRKSVIASKNPDIDTMRLDEQFRVLIKGPLSERDIIPSTKVIIIDALDECNDLIDAAKIINLLNSLGSSSPLQFRLLVTSRDEYLARKAIEHQVHIPLPLATRFREDNISDITSILRLGIENLRKEARIDHTWPTEEQFEVVLQRSIHPSPLFIYAATLLRFLNNAKRTGYLEQRLDKWIEKDPGTADASQLEVMYTTVFENLDRNMDDGSSGFLMDEEKEDLRNILGTIVLATEPLTREAIASISRVAPDQTRGLLNLCRAVLEISDDDRQPVETVHRSFGDFLLRKSTRGRSRSWYHVDEVKLNDRIADGCMRVLRTLRKDICDFRDPGVSRAAINPSVIKSHICRSVQYASSWWHHLQRGNKRGASYDSLVPTLKIHFLHWLECLSILDRLPFASKAVRELCASLMVIIIL
jgi:energy-coupling factor transporter ATP-binding protein EcfA2